MGKSHILYHLVAELRADRANYRVTYINDCAEWRDDPNGHFLEELIMSFYDDVVEDKGIVQWCDEIVGSEKEEKMKMMVKALTAYTKEKGPK